MQLGNVEELISEFIKKRSGFSDTFADVTDQIRILRGEVTTTGIELEKMADFGVGQAKLDELRQLFEERDRLEANQRKSEERQRAVEAAVSERQMSAEDIINSLKSPLQLFQEEQARVFDLVDRGLLTAEQGGAYLATQDPANMEAPAQLAGAVEAGSQEAFSAILNATIGGRKSQEVTAIEKQTEQLKEALKASKDFGGEVHQLPPVTI